MPAGNVGYSCNLLKPDMEMMLLQADSLERTQALIEAGFNKMASVHAQDQPSPQTKIKFAIVIDGETLRYALDVPLKRLFLNLGKQCETVVCCRVSPAQKALTVKLVRSSLLSSGLGSRASCIRLCNR
jgi:phospholipid-translocating ATPase